MINRLYHMAFNVRRLLEAHTAENTPALQKERDY